MKIPGQPVGRSVGRGFQEIRREDREKPWGRGDTKKFDIGGQTRGNAFEKNLSLRRLPPTWQGHQFNQGGKERDEGGPGIEEKSDGKK